jgi:glycosyltransferase involved in cell wall biosynthesis
MDTTTPTVSINLCCYNSEQFLRETLASIAGQTWKDWELIIVNDGSTDGTEAIVLDFLRQGFPVKYICQENKGLGEARNRALVESSGRYIAFIDHDDLWLPPMLSEMVGFLDSHPSLVLAFCDSEHFDEQNRTIRTEFEPFPIDRIDLRRGKVAKELVVKHCFIKPLSALARLEAIRLVGGVNENLCFAEDYDLWLRLGAIGDFGVMRKVLARYRRHSNQLTSRLGARKVEEQLFAYISALRHFNKLDRAQVLFSVVARRVAKYALLSIKEDSFLKNITQLVRGFPQYKRSKSYEQS